MNIDGREIVGQVGQTVLEAAQSAGIFIPSLCFEKSIGAIGSCGLCLVEVTNGTGTLPGQLVRACGTIISPGLVVRTDTQRVRPAQRKALEMLLSVHGGDCVAPCQMACPAGTDCRGFVSLMAAGKTDEAYALLMEAHPFPGSLGYICPRPCEHGCRRGLRDEAVDIAGLKRMVIRNVQPLPKGEMSNVAGATNRRKKRGDDSQTLLLESPPSEAQNDSDSSINSFAKSIAIIGGGPAGLTAAYFLKRAGYAVTVYEREAQMGGLLRYGIPAYRLPKDVLDNEIAVLADMGIKFVNNTSLGNVPGVDVSVPASINTTHAIITLETLRKENDAVIIAIGAGCSKPLGCLGDDLPHVFGGTVFLRWAALGLFIAAAPLKRVIVVGGSNTAMDAARTALRLGAEKVIVAYRRTRVEMPAEAHEIEAAEAEGVVFHFLVAPLEVTEAGVRLQVMELGEPDAGGRRSPKPVAGKEITLPADTIISAIGQGVDLTGLDGITTTRWGTPAADPVTFATNVPGVYAVGDVTGESAYAIEAISHGRKTAAAIIKGTLPNTLPPTLFTTTPTPANFTHIPVVPRQHPPLTPESAKKEATRCFSCGCGGFHKCKLISLANQLNIKIKKHNTTKINTPPQSTPGLSHEPQKCILCGLCQRACDKKNDGKGILSAARRGYHTFIYTDLLNTAPCQNCTECVNICPTGAITQLKFTTQQ